MTFFSRRLPSLRRMCATLGIPESTAKEIRLDLLLNQPDVAATKGKFGGLAYYSSNNIPILRYFISDSPLTLVQRAGGNWRISTLEDELVSLARQGKRVENETH